jgi:hypothetical protein
MSFTLTLVLVFGSVFSSSRGVFADDMGGTMDGGGNDGNSMPPPEDAPATTDALTAGGGSDNDDDDEGNDDDSGGSQDNDDDNDNDNDKGNDNDKDNAQIPNDAPTTTNALTAKRIECPPGQEVTLFSTTCKPAVAPPIPGEECPKGQMKVEGNCVPISLPKSNSGCLEGQMKVEGNCVQMPPVKQSGLCPTSFIDSGRLIFVADMTGVPQDSTTCKPAVAPPIPGEECPKGQMKVEGNCVPISLPKSNSGCLEGQMKVEGNCVPIS